MTGHTASLEKGASGRPRTPAWDGWKGYLLAGLALTAAFEFRWALDPLWGDRLPFGTFFLLELALVQFVASGPFLFMMVGSLLLADWFFIPPRHSLLIADRLNQVNAVFFILVSATLWWLTVRARRAQGRELVAEQGRNQAEEESARLAAIVESSDDAIIGKSLEGIILSWNRGAERLYGYSSTKVIGKSIGLLMPPEKTHELAPLLEQVRRGQPVRHFESLRLTRDGRVIPVSLSISPMRNREGAIAGAATIARDISERKQAEQERERLVRELQAALANVKTLSGLLPICAHCKNIRDDKGYWNQIEIYIRDHSEAQFTHGICPDCIRKLYPHLVSPDEPL